MAQLYNCAQRSELWDWLRLGIPTASCFGRIITAKGKPSRQWRTYAHQLLTQRYRGFVDPEDEYVSPLMQRGAELEEHAIAWYEYDRDIDTEAIGFATTDDGKAGCSPDRLVGEDGLLEIKIPKPATHWNYLLFGEIEDDYRPQLQGQLFVLGRQWVDCQSWHEVLPRAEAIRVPRDEQFIAALKAQLAEFNAYLDGVTAKVCPDWRERKRPPGAAKDPRPFQPSLKEWLHSKLAEGRT